MNVTSSQPSPAEGLIPKVEVINGKSLVTLGREESGQIVAIKTGTYIYLKFDPASGAAGFEFSPLGIVEPPPGTFHLPKNVIGILQALNPGTARITIKTRPPHASTGNGNPSGIISLNWSGYEIIGGPFTKISGQWTVPAVSGDGGSNSVSWIGIDGVVDGDNNLIQVGTEQDWNSGVVGIGEGPSYYAWWEILPKGQTRLPNQVLPGDVMYAEITQTDAATSTWSIKLIDTSLGWTAEVQVTYTAPLSSVEWIEEAPTTCPVIGSCTIASLADYGWTNFEVGLTTPDTGNLSATESVNLQQGGVIVSSPSNPDPVSPDPASCGIRGFNIAFGGTSPAPDDCSNPPPDCTTKTCKPPAVCCDCTTTVLCTSLSNCQRLCAQSPRHTRRSK